MNLYGRLLVSLSEEREFDREHFAEIINAAIKPPRSVRAEDIYVRAIYLVSNQVNSYGGRFPDNELQNLCELIIDSPVLVGHNRRDLPIARNFKAEVIEKGGEKWVKVWFYWLWESQGSKALLSNIDGGIYKEGSIGFIFSFPECSICGEDIRNCAHTPLKSYPSDQGEEICHYSYRKIEKVLETSLVFRGATADTRTTNELTGNSGNTRKQGGYMLKRIKDSAIIEFEHKDIPFTVIFPQFNIASLKRKGSLVGYPVSDERQRRLDLRLDKLKGRREKGELEIEGKRRGGFLLRLNGRTLEGRYLIRPAFWDKRRLVLFTRLS
ncbi:MAG TPA: hypothetical protein ENO22_14375 [candidate division Zixibacteria bacterium]|nr:hypothetical protein [candidate division Zixibacteria bacterium]